jgi:hypothetical protein
LHLDAKAAKRAMDDFEIQPSDVYDLATLLVSDLTYLYGRLKDVPPIPSVPFPGRKFPSHVYHAGSNTNELTRASDTHRVMFCNELKSTK